KPVLTVAAEALARIAPEPARKLGIRRLEKRLLTEDDPTRIAVAILHLDKEHALARATLQRVLQEAELFTDPALVSALAALGHAGPAAKAALDDVRALLHDHRSIVRIAAAEVVWRIGKDPDACVPVLLDALAPAQAAGVRYEALVRLAEMGP